MTRGTNSGVVLAFVAGSAVMFLGAARGAADIPPTDPTCLEGDGCGGDPTPTPGPTPTPTPTPTPVVTEPSAPPELISPRGSVVASRFGLLWREAPNAVTYRVTLIDATTGTVLHNTFYASWDVCIRGSCLAEVAPVPGSYRWRVAAIDGGGQEWVAEFADIDVTTESLARLVFLSYDTGRVIQSFLRDGTVVGDAPLSGPSAWNQRVVGTADFNGDGRQDLAWRPEGTPHSRFFPVTVWETYGTGVRVGAHLPSVDVKGLRSMADFNRDGSPDLLMRETDSGPARLCYLSGVESIPCEPLPSHDDEYGHYDWDLAGTGDFNHDLWLDIVWQDRRSGFTKVWYMHGREKVGESVVRLLGDDRLLGVGDVNGDGISDLLRYRYADRTLRASIVQVQPDGHLFVASEVILGPAPGLHSWLVAYLPPELPRTAPVTVNGAASAITVAPGESVLVHVVDGPGQPTDWIGKYALNAPNDGFFPDWRYLDGSQAVPAAGRTSATISFTMPAALGEYNFRFFESTSPKHLLGTSPTVKVTSPATLRVNGSSEAQVVGPASLLTVHVGRAVGYPLDWVGLYEVSAGHRPFEDWKYLDGSQQISENQSVPISATLTFRAPLETGDYHFRLLYNDGNMVMATSPKVAVRPLARVTVNGSPSPLVVAPGETVTVGVSDAPGLAADWVGRHESSAPDTVHPDWQYLDGSQTPPPLGRTAATLRFVMPTAPGKYDFRLFYNDGHRRLAISPTVTVAAP